MIEEEFTAREEKIREKRRQQNAKHPTLRHPRGPHRSPSQNGSSGPAHQRRTPSPRADRYLRVINVAKRIVDSMALQNAKRAKKAPRRRQLAQSPSDNGGE
ncbi:hypothetical protein ACFLZP_00485 [Patescibacteria group bacterium]